MCESNLEVVRQKPLLLSELLCESVFLNASCKWLALLADITLMDQFMTAARASLSNLE